MLMSPGVPREGVGCHVLQAVASRHGACSPKVEQAPRHPGHKRAPDADVREALAARAFTGVLHDARGEGSVTDRDRWWSLLIWGVGLNR